MNIERRWLIIPTSLTGSIDFNQVRESSLDSLRLSLDGTKTFVKYDVQIFDEDYSYTYVDAEDGEEKTHTTLAGVYGRPTIYEQGIQEYNYDEILTVLAGPDWTKTTE